MKTDSAPAVSFRHYGGSAPENYERYFVPTIGAAWATALLDVAGLSSGERVLDVACGTGIVTRRASELVGPEGFVAGLDVNPAMLAVARSVSPTSIEWHESSAESIPCPDASFDVVTCSLGLQFVPDRSAAMREIRRVLADGGRVAIGTGGAIPPVFEILAQALARHVKPEVAAFVRQVFSLHEPRELHALAEGAGLRSVSVESKAQRIMLPPPSEFLWQYVTSTPLAGPVGEIGDAERAALERDVTTAWRTFLDGDALRLDIDAVLTTARK
jgi:ubiquinone/menaquinone biosynthesis C-methylase UbiE